MNTCGCRASATCSAVVPAFGAPMSRKSGRGRAFGILSIDLEYKGGQRSGEWRSGESRVAKLRGLGARRVSAGHAARVLGWCSLRCIRMRLELLYIPPAPLHLRRALLLL